MLSMLTIKMRLILGFCSILLLAVAIITPIMLDEVRVAVNESSDIQLTELFNNTQVQLSEQARRAEMLGVLVADLPLVQQSFAENNRGALTALLLNAFKHLQTDYGVVQMQFHTLPAISFLRTHDLTKHGDDLLAFRKTVVEENSHDQAVRSLETGVNGLGMRGLVTVHFQGKQVGTLEFGLNFGQEFFNRFKEKHHVEIDLQLYQQGKFQSYAYTLNAAIEAAKAGAQG